MFAVIIPFYFLMTASNSGNVWISVKVLLYLMVMQILFLVKLLKNYSSQEMKILLYLTRNQTDQTERYFHWLIALKMDVNEMKSESFESVALLEEYVLASNRKGSAEICSMNRVK